MTQLHITNGDSTGDMLHESKTLSGDILCWRDVLHDGPILAVPYAEYAQSRAGFIASVCVSAMDNPNEIQREDIYQDFLQRQAMMDKLGDYDEVILWFEHDLYDQLHLAEILPQLCLKQTPNTRYSMICIDQHADVPFFQGLGNLNIEQLEALFPARQAITSSQIVAAEKVWRAFQADDPSGLLQLPRSVFSHLPFMKAALLRFCQEYPLLQSGLTLTQQYLLAAVAEPMMELPALKYELERLERVGWLPRGTTAQQRYREITEGEIGFGRIFHQLQHCEQASFMGDLWVKKELDTLCQAQTPYLICTHFDRERPFGMRTTYEVTEAGRQAFAGQLHWADVNNYDFWRGGVHVTTQEPYYWQERPRQFIRQR